MPLPIRSWPTEGIVEGPVPPSDTGNTGRAPFTPVEINTLKNRIIIVRLKNLGNKPNNLFFRFFILFINFIENHDH